MKDGFQEWKSTHPERDQRSAFMGGVEWTDAWAMKWVKGILDASDGNLDPELVEEAKRILED